MSDDDLDNSVEKILEVEFAEAECFSHRTSSFRLPYVAVQLINGQLLELNVDHDYLHSTGDLNNADESWNMLTLDELEQCMHVTFQEINQSLTKMVPCLRCRSCVKNFMQRLDQNTQPAYERIVPNQIYPLCLHGPSCVSLHERFMQKCRSTRTYDLLHHHSFDYKVAKSRKAKSSLCAFHKQRPKLNCAWVDLWDNLNDYQKHQITQIREISFTLRLKRYVDCTDCYKHIYAAYLLVCGMTAAANEEFKWDESRREQTGGFTLTVKDGIIFLPTQIKHIAALMSKAEDEVNWEPQRDHTRGWARSLKTVQIVLGMMLWEQFESLWHRVRKEKHSMQCFVRVCLKCFQNKIEAKMHEKEGEAQLQALIDSLEDEKKSTKKGKKKKKRRKKKQAGKPEQSQVCNKCGAKDPLEWNDAERLFLGMLGWSENNRSGWEAEPLDQVSTEWKVIKQKRMHCQQCLLNSWRRYCDIS